MSGSSIAVSVSEFQQKVLPASVYQGLAAPFNEGTYVWGFQSGNGAPQYPGATLEAKRGITTRVLYTNNLLTPVLQKYLTVDQTIHWADPLMQMGSRDPYTGPVPFVPHIHGAEVPSQYDGGPEQWFTASGLRGITYRSAEEVLANQAVFEYPNSQESTALWIHDHTLGMTRLNVYAGLALFYIIRDDADTGKPGNPLRLPAGNYEVELLIQDRQFDTNGQWLYGDGTQAGAVVPPTDPADHPYWTPGFVGDVIVVNGKSWPVLDVEPRRYRLRLVNGANTRFFDLSLFNQQDQKPGPSMWVIGTDGGLLDAPVMVRGRSTPRRGAESLLVAPGERFDLIVDFSRFAGQTLTLMNSAPVPYPNGIPVDPGTTAQVMQFRVASGSVVDLSYVPALGRPLRQPMIRLVDPSTGNPATGVTPALTRQLSLNMPAGPSSMLLNNTTWSGLEDGTTTPIPGSSPDGFGNFMTETPRVGSTEIWEIVNLVDETHPIHLHLVQFQVLNRQSFDVAAYTTAYNAAFAGGAYVAGGGPPMAYNSTGKLGGNPDVTPYLQGQAAPPDPEEAGWKDTVRCEMGTVTRLMIRWAPQSVAVADVAPGQNRYPFDPTQGPGYVWHCHYFEHEDNEMMRPYLPVP